MAKAKAPDPIDVHVGARIKAARVKGKIKQGYLADSLGITFQQVQKYEKGTNRVGASRLQAISNILQLPISYFFAENDQSMLSIAEPGTKAEDPVGAFLSSKEGMELNEAFTKLENVDLRRSIVRLVTALGAAHADHGKLEAGLNP